MDFGRQDYNESIVDQSGTIPENEPVFLIRAQDLVGFQAVRSYAHFLKVNGGSDTVAAHALEQAEKMEAWNKKKLATL